MPHRHESSSIKQAKSLLLPGPSLKSHTRPKTTCNSSNGDYPVMKRNQSSNKQINYKNVDMGAKMRKMPSESIFRRQKIEDAAAY